MRALITGVTGFAGGYLAQVLLKRGDEVFGVARQQGLALEHLDHQVTQFSLDLCDSGRVTQLLIEVQPEAIYHLAGQAFVPTAWADPWNTMENNIRPQLNILQAMVKEKSEARLLVVTSNQVYGNVSCDQLPVTEDMPICPSNPYGVSKAAQDMLALQYHLSHGMDILRVRAFNHIGPRQSPRFVAASFAKQIAEIEAGLRKPIIYIGNLSAKRDFTDVHDVVQAYALLVEHGEAGEVYNVGTGHSYSIQHLLDILLNYSNVDITIEIDPTRMRPSDTPDIYADNSKLQAATGWEPTYTFEESLHYVLEYWREQVSISSKVAG